MASYSRSLTPSRQPPGMDSAAIARAQQQHRANTMQQQIRAAAPVQPNSCPVAILWDIENCPVPGEVNAEDVAGNIRIALREHPHVGAVTMFSAYGDFNHFPRKVREGCQRTGVNLIDVPNGKKDAADKAILVDMFLFALDNPPPSTIFLITGDVDFAPALHKLGQRGYVVVLVIPDGVGVSSALRGAGRFVYDWPCLCRGEGLQNPQRQGRQFNNMYPVDDRSQGRVPNSIFTDVDRIPANQFQDTYSEYVRPLYTEETDPRIDEDVYGEEILPWGGPSNTLYNVQPVDYGHQPYVMTGQVQPQGPRLSPGFRNPHIAAPGQLRNPVSGGFVDSRGRSTISATDSAVQAGDPEEGTCPDGSSPLWAPPGDLIGLKRQLVQLLNQNGGQMMLSKVPAEYNKLFGRPLYLADYNAQRLVHLIDKMKDALLIKGDGTSKTLHVLKKEPARVTNKYKPSSNRASALKGDKDKDAGEDSEPEGALPPSKEVEKETSKIEFANDLLSKSSLLEVEMDTEKVPFVGTVDPKRHLLDMDMEETMEETIVVQSASSWNPPSDDVKFNVHTRKFVPIVDVEEDDIKVDDFIAPDVQLTHLENLRVFKRQLEELLVVYSYQIDYSDFNRVYKQRYGRNLDFSSFGVDSMDSLVAKVQDVATIKDVEGTVWLMAV
ncbi:uncharacterized protein [Physcomitrium patens]|uniref:HTH OST-type domain-containing protein n=1 Tax=Physcomitrium patens TaxID=3218 RepID=A0A2K1J9Q2_PHYPA|nr:uncharacterized protein LOC112293456 [Physcomitrium patens]XP_024398662.1 uncharacterized protein LOC112293456 [Physcomitrium patens]XP_024398663.1 uncharacterized protein LOC112293456 [Physcomitrium patens]PNR38258.1 hypothetical protein PHYPA_021369 [Physcomitrium patens]|eukprot:XP_024398661.1 uncharacterized protein LOC112293456 [Physcomitrella patens]